MSDGDPHIGVFFISNQNLMISTFIYYIGHKKDLDEKLTYLKKVI